MPTAILITFEYTFKSLPGAMVDLYHAWTWCQSFHCRTHFITDIKSITDPDNLERVVHRKIADANLLTFYTEPSLDKRIITNQSDLLQALDAILQVEIPDNKLVIYYSGHGVKDSMVMPDKSLFPFVDFRDAILDLLPPYVEIFWILDCCNPNGLHLPYKLNNNRFTLSESKIQCVSQPILLITSSDPNEKSIATKFGSIFTRHLFRILNQLNLEIPIRKRVSIPIQKNRNLRRLIGNLGSSIRKMDTGYAQTVSIYSSYIMDPLLWMWIGSSPSADIVTDMTLTTLIFRQPDPSTLIPLRTSDSLLVPSKRGNAPKRRDDHKRTNELKRTKEPEYVNPYDLLYPD